MWLDPIVEETRRAGAELAKNSNYDLHTFFQDLRYNEKKRKSRVISRYKADKICQSKEAYGDK